MGFAAQNNRVARPKLAGRGDSDGIEGGLVEGGIAVESRVEVAAGAEPPTGYLAFEPERVHALDMRCALTSHDRRIRRWAGAKGCGIRLNRFLLVDFDASTVLEMPAQKIVGEIEFGDMGVFVNIFGRRINVFCVDSAP